MSEPRHFSMLRTFVLADFITLANASAGTSIVFLLLSYLGEGGDWKLKAAFVLFPLALLADMADGAVARWRHKASPLGADLDSLSDVISFGVAPAALGFALGLDGGIDAAVLVYFVACGVSRLARFNATASALSDGTGKVKYYQGTPIPTSLGLVLILGIAWWKGAVGDALWGGELALGPLTLHPLTLMYALSGSAMISGTLKIPKP